MYTILGKRMLAQGIWEYVVVARHGSLCRPWRLAQGTKVDHCLILCGFGLEGPLAAAH